MRDLPQERLSIGKTPFNNTGANYFGPYYVKSAMVYCVWCMVYGVWCYGVWYIMLKVLWCIVHLSDNEGHPYRTCRRPFY